MEVVVEISGSINEQSNLRNIHLMAIHCAAAELVRVSVLIKKKEKKRNLSVRRTNYQIVMHYIYTHQN